MPRSEPRIPISFLAWGRPYIFSTKYNRPVSASKIHRLHSQRCNSWSRDFVQSFNTGVWLSGVRRATPSLVKVSCLLGAGVVRSTPSSFHIQVRLTRCWRDGSHCTRTHWTFFSVARPLESLQKQKADRSCGLESGRHFSGFQTGWMTDVGRAIWQSHVND